VQELAHYALSTTDLQFRFPWGWDELWGIANRGDYDLRAHAAASGAPLHITTPDGKQVCHRWVRPPPRPTSPLPSAHRRSCPTRWSRRWV